MFGSRFYKLTAPTLAFVLIIGGCGGGGGGIAGIDRSGSRTVSGPIDGFGSVIVDGVRYSTEGAEIFVSGESSNEDELKVGDYITVVADVTDSDAPKAEKVYYQPNVIGPISQLDAETEQFVILGQTIQITEETSFDKEFDERSILGLKDGDVVVVSGPSEGDAIVATRIRKKDTTLLEVSGNISELDTDNLTFKLRNQLINYAQANISRELENGDSVVVRGQNIEGEFLIAERVRQREEKSYATEGRRIEISGYIWKFVNAKQFNVLDFEVVLNENAEFIRGSSEDLRNKRRVKIKGTLAADGKLVVDKIEVSHLANTTLSGVISSIEIGEARHFGRATDAVISIDDMDIIVDRKTRLDGKGNDFRHGRMSINDIRIGDSIRAVGHYEGFTLKAKYLEVERKVGEERRRVELQGQPEAVDETTSSFSLNGYSITLGDQTQIYKGFSKLNVDQLFNLISEGRVIEVLGRSDENKNVNAMRIRVAPQNDRFKKPDKKHK